MQRGKLYNLHKIAYFIVALFVFKMDKILSDQISIVRKWDFFLYKMNSFSLISSYYHLICFVKKNKIQREKHYNLQRAIKKRWNEKKTNSSCIKNNLIFAPSKFDSSKFCPFWKQKVQLENKLYFVCCRAFHAASCFFLM